MPQAKYKSLQQRHAPSHYQGRISACQACRSQESQAHFLHDAVAGLRDVINAPTAQVGGQVRPQRLQAGLAGLRVPPASSGWPAVACLCPCMHVYAGYQMQKGASGMPAEHTQKHRLGEPDQPPKKFHAC